MPRQSRYPLTYDSIRKLTLTELKQMGWLIEGCRATGSLRWTRGGQTTSSISIITQTQKKTQKGPIGLVTLAYKADGVVMQQDIRLTTVSSNLGRGVFWYFICPVTGERCRTLYQVGDKFASRKAVNGAIYESQTVSKVYRWYDAVYGPEFKLDRLYGKLKRYSKRSYRGKPTPLMGKILNMEHRARLDYQNGHILDAKRPKQGRPKGSVKSFSTR